MSRLWSILLAFAFLGWVACGDGDTRKTADTGGLTLNFDLATDGPRLADTFQVVGLDATPKIVYGPVSVERSSQVVLTGVPLSVERVQVTFLLGATPIGLLSAPVDLTPGSATVDLSRLAITPVAQLVSLEVTPAAAELAVGGIQPFRATGRFDDGASYDLSTAVTWSSGDGTVASIDGDGRASGLAAGVSSLTASLSGVASAPAILTVTGPARPAQLPTISAVSPRSGPSTGGTQVTITGTNLRDATAVRFGTAPALSVTVMSATTIVVGAPAGASGTVHVSVSTALGTSAPSAADEFTYLAVPTVAAVTPAHGAVAGGTTIVIAGQGLGGATAVRVGGTPASSFTVDSDAQITAVTPPGAGDVHVTVSAPAGSSAAGAGSAYSYVAAPVVSKVTPGNGPIAGGNPVVFTGQNLTHTTAVAFGAASATFVVDSPTQVTATAPAGSGVVAATLTSVGGTSAPLDYAYLPIPALATLAPGEGPLAGGTQVTLTGSGLEAATHVDFGDAPATSFEVVSDTQIRAVAPARTGTVQVRVTTPVGQSNGVAYLFRPLPTVASAQPSSGPESGGNPVTLTGTGFTGATAVRFGSVAATMLTVVSDTQLTAVAPAGTGSAGITVVTAGGTSAARAYQYAAMPSLTQVAPSAGPVGGGTLVTLTGTQFTGATAVRFGAAAASSFTVFSSTQISAVAPAGTGTAMVTVVSPGGVSNGAPFLYAAQPTITALAPAAGPEPGGHTLVITGTGFVGVTAVTFGSVGASGLTVQSPTQLTVNVPAGTGTVLVTVTASGGTSASQPYTYVPGPSIVSLQPARGPLVGGTSVTLLGGPFVDVSAVKFGTTPALAYTVVSSSEVSALAPPGTGVQGVTVVTTGGTSSAVPYAYVPVPTVTALAPAVGPLVGGNWIVITGTALSDATEVHFDAIPATDFTLVSATEIHAQAPPGTGIVDLTVTTAGGTSVGFPYAFEAPATLSAALPASGPAVGGQMVVLTGAGFTDASAVRFGATPAAAFTVDSDTQITAVTPAGTGSVSITVTTPLGVSNTQPYAYVAAPMLTSVSPTHGPLAGGTSLTLTGVHLTGATAVTVGGAPVAFLVASPTSITLITSAAAAGASTISVTTAGGTATLPASFTYASAPTLASITPVGGAPAGGNVVTLAGTGFTLATQVLFGSTPGTALNATSDTAATVLAPVGMGSVMVTVVGPGGTSNGRSYVYTPAPVIASVSPTHLPLAGGSLTLTGSGFSAASAFTVDGSPMATMVMNDGVAIVTAQAHAAGAVAVQAASLGGASNAGSVTYVASPVLTSLSPTAGPVAGNTAVTITGTDLATTSGVTFDGVAGGMLMATSDTSVLVVAPAHAAGAVDVAVTTAGGTVTSVGGYTYVNAPSLTTLSPNAGPMAGGTSVTVSGTGFVSGDTSVSFGSTTIPSGSVTVNSSTSLTVTTPANSAGAVSVTVTTAGGTTAPQSFTYVGAPVVTSVSPTSGSTAGGTVLTVTGSGFVPGSTQLSIGGNLVVATVNSATSLTATTPAHAAGAVDVDVTTAGGTATLVNGYTYVVPPTTLTAASPATGTTAGGGVVVLTGSGFTGTTSVTFGGMPATSFTVNSDTQITATTPAGSAGATTADVTSPLGTASTAFTYVDLPTLTSVTPNSGPFFGGGGQVVIVGTNLQNVTSLSFTWMAMFTTLVASGTFVSQSATQIVIASPTSPIGPGIPTTLTATNASGTSNGLPFTFN